MPRDLAIITRSHFGIPAWEDKRLKLTVDIVSSRAKDALVRPSVTLDKFKSTAQTVILKYLDLGFEPVNLSVFIASHPNAIIPKTGFDGEPYARVISESAYKKAIGRDRYKSIQIEANEAGLYYGYTNAESALAENHSIFAHEYAHVLQPRFFESSSKQRQYAAWFEARADFFAYLITGKKEMRSPCLAEDIGPGGPAEEIVRDISNLNISKTPTKIQAMVQSAYHVNSVFLSNYLYQFESHFGRPAVLELIDAMDKRILRDGTPNSPKWYRKEYDPYGDLVKRYANSSGRLEYLQFTSGMLYAVDNLKSVTLEIGNSKDLSGMEMSRLVSYLENSMILIP